MAGAAELRRPLPGAALALGVVAKLSFTGEFSNNATAHSGAAKLAYRW
jgi:hypothetical protein